MGAIRALALLVACDAGKPTAPAKPPEPAPAAPAAADGNTTISDDARAITQDAPVATPTDGPHVIDWELGGLGVWEGQAVGGLMWKVVIDLDKKSMTITNPGSVTKTRKLTADAVASYTRLARAMLVEKHSKPSNSCTDRLETLRVDKVSVEDSCPLSDPGAAALTAAIDKDLESEQQK